MSPTAILVSLPGAGLDGSKLAVAQSRIMHAGLTGSNHCCCSVTQAHVQAVGRVDTDGSRWLLGDHLGNLSLLVLNHDGPRVLSLALEPLGTVSAAVTLTYLDSGVIYVGSCSGMLMTLRSSYRVYVQSPHVHVALGYCPGTRLPSPLMQATAAVPPAGTSASLKPCVSCHSHLHPNFECQQTLSAARWLAPGASTYSFSTQNPAASQMLKSCTALLTRTASI